MSRWMRAACLAGGVLLGGCTSVEANATFNVADWDMPALGKDRPVTWIIESPAIIATEVAELGLPAGTLAYVLFTIVGSGWRCEIHAPPLNDVAGMNLLRHELAHCVTGRFH